MRIISSVMLLAITTPAFAAEKPQKPQTIVIASDTCLITGETQAQGHGFFSAIVAILVPIVADLAIDAVTTELKKVRSITSSGDLDLDLFTKQSGSIFPVSQRPKCITIVTGQFDNEVSARLASVDFSTKIKRGAGKDLVIKRLAQNGIAAKELHSILEVKIEESNDKTAFRYKPAYVNVFSLMPGQSPKKQGLVFNISMRGPGASPNGTTYSMAPISLGEVSAGFELHQDNDADKIAKLSTGYLIMPGMSEQAYQAYIQDVVSDKPTGSYMPVNLKADVVQTAKPSDAALALATILEKAKPKLSEAAGKAVTRDDPFTVSQAKIDAQIAVKQAEVELQTATTENNSVKIELATLKKQKAQAALDELMSN